MLGKVLFAIAIAIVPSTVVGYRSVFDQSSQALDLDALEVQSEQPMTEVCSNAVKNSVPRECSGQTSRQFWSLFRSSTWGCWSGKECKCPSASVMQGGPECSKAGRKFKASDLTGKNCECKWPEYVPIADMVPDFGLLYCGTEYYFGAHNGMKDFASEAYSWCNSKLVPAEKRVPKKLAGLFWMKDLSLEDVAFCPSLGEWDDSNPKAPTLKLAVWTHFVFRKEKGETTPYLARYVAGKSMDSFGHLEYTLTFNEDLTAAEIWTNHGIVNALIKFPMKELDETPDGIKKEQDGDIWDRPSFFGLGVKFEATSARYFAVRIMDDDGNINQDRYEKMKQSELPLIEEKGGGEGSMMRFAQKCPGHGM